jgi:putative phosphoribosyl transferase
MFRDRIDAGRQLAARLTPWSLLPGLPGPPVVLGLPRGGVPVAAEVARALDAPLDVLVIRKIGVPWQPELALGAAGEGGVRVINERIRAGTGLGTGDVDELAARAGREVDQRLQRFRQGCDPVPLAGRAAVVVDDGIATGATMRAAVDVVREHGAAGVVIAVPVAAADSLAALAGAVDEVVSLMSPRDLVGVGLWYSDFTQTGDDEVAALLAASRS